MIHIRVYKKELCSVRFMFIFLKFTFFRSDVQLIKQHNTIKDVTRVEKYNERQGLP